MKTTKGKLTENQIAKWFGRLNQRLHKSPLPANELTFLTTGVFNDDEISAFIEASYNAGPDKEVRFWLKWFLLRDHPQIIIADSFFYDAFVRVKKEDEEKVTIEIIFKDQSLSPQVRYRSDLTNHGMIPRWCVHLFPDNAKIDIL